MHATGARALLSATLAAPTRTCSAAVSRLHCSRRPRAYGVGAKNRGNTTTSSSSARSFRSSSARQARPDEPGSGNGRAEDGGNRRSGGVDGQDGSDKPLEQQPAARQVGGAGQGGGNGTIARSTRTAAADSASAADLPKNAEQALGLRSRAGRGRNQEALPPVNLPDWFLDDHVSIYDLQRISERQRPSLISSLVSEKEQGLEEKVIAALVAAGRDGLVSQREHLEIWQAATAWNEQNVAETIRQVKAGNTRPLEDRLFLSSLTTSCLAATLAFDPERADRSEYTELLRSLPKEPRLYLRKITETFPFESLTTEEEEHHIRDGMERRLCWSATSNRPEEEFRACRELLAAIRAGLDAPVPDAKAARDVRRPVPVLTVLNYSGTRASASVVNDIAEDLGADVVRLDAFSLAQIVGTYLGQTPYWSRGALATLGYAAAEVNGRLASRHISPKENDDLESLVSVRLRKPLGILLSGKAGPETYATHSDDRWEDLKMNRILEELVLAADEEQPSATPSAAPRRLIIHLQDYAELCSIPDGASIVTKLRAVVDRMWLKGRKVVFVGSSSGNINAPQWQEAISELSKDGHFLVPYRVMDKENRDAWAKQDNLQTNTSNLQSILRAMTGKAINLDLKDGEIVKGSAKMLQFLSETVYDMDWISRFASLLTGQRSYYPLTFDARHMTEVFFSLRRVDNDWKEHDPKIKEPYFSPLNLDPRADSSESKGGDSFPGMPPFMQGEDDLEKKLMSGLVNAKDIKTTFDDVVAPRETKESLKALTTLSLIRPEAFSYGVLATERIPGCLLYGPPGTGKTLMAKAIAKESGANMLEVSAASINDMWRGNAEKNVRAVFSIARKMSPMVIFLDEADALLGARSSSRHSGGGHRLVINQFLREWDGITDMKAFIMVATNRPFDLDDAVLRRLPRKILIDLPIREARLDILKVMLAGEVLEASVSLERIARETELYSGSDLKNVCVAAAMEAVKEEVRARDSHQGPGEYIFPERRVLTGVHFDKAMREISASINEDMGTLKAIRKFDEQYGDSGRRKKQNSMGFGAFLNVPNTEDARVRTGTPP